MTERRLLRVFLTIVCCGVASAASAQRSTEFSIKDRDRQAALAQGLTRIAGVRELQDGRVILLDADDRLVYIVSIDLGEARQIGRAGEGPGEYRLPSRLLPLRGDTTALLDLQDARLLTITPSGEAGDVLGVGSGAALRPTVPPSASDIANHFYGRASPIRTMPDGSRQTTDSAAILRWRHGESPDTAAFVAVDREGYRIEGGFVRSSPIPPFAPRPAWSVSIDGWVAVAYPDPYHVVLVKPDGLTLQGPVIPYDGLRVTDAHKRAYREAAERPRPMLSVRRNDPGSGTVTMLRRPFREPSEWPDVLPPFLATAVVQFDVDGDLWIERTTDAGAPAAYDVIRRDGSVRGHVVLPAGRRLAGFGREDVYLVRRDEFDLEYLERYRRPRLDGPT